jgi:hypothetical protein
MAVTVKISADDISALNGALMAIDAEVRSIQGGAIGTGLYSLLEIAGTQLLGLPRTPGYTPEPPPPPPPPDQVRGETWG